MYVLQKSSRFRQCPLSERDLLRLNAMPVYPKVLPVCPKAVPFPPQKSDPSRENGKWQKDSTMAEGKGCRNGIFVKKSAAHMGYEDKIRILNRPHHPILSMPGKENPDRAAAEDFLSILKTESVPRIRPKNHGVLRLPIEGHFLSGSCDKNAF